MARDRAGTSVAWYRRATAIDPLDPRGYANLGIALASLGRFEDARIALGEAHARLPTSARIENNLGLVNHRIGRLDAAERAFRHAIRLDPALAEAYANLGTLLESRGQICF